MEFSRHAQLVSLGLMALPAVALSEMAQAAAGYEISENGLEEAGFRGLSDLELHAKSMVEPSTSSNSEPKFSSSIKGSSKKSSSIVQDELLIASSEIVPDDTLGSEQTIVTPVSPTVSRIEGGAIRGENLFHSFEQFNVGEGQNVFFDNSTKIDNILGRVTGDDISDILGKLSVYGGASLYLINPNGFVFGPNSKLDIGGEFAAATSNRIVFSNGDLFTVGGLEKEPLLTVDAKAPLGFEFIGERTGNIYSEGELSADNGFSLYANNMYLSGQINTNGNLNLQAQNLLEIRDSKDKPFQLSSSGQSLLQANTDLDIFALNNLDSYIASSEDLLLRSSQPVRGDIHFISGGDFRVETLDGSLGDLYSPFSVGFRTIGDFSIQNYFGSSLHILAGGSVSISDARIIDSQKLPSGFDFTKEIIELSNGNRVAVDGANQPTVDIRAGVSDLEGTRFSALNELSSKNNLSYVSSHGISTTEDSDNSVANELPSANIDIGSIWVSALDNSLVMLTNQYVPNQDRSGNLTIHGERGYGGINVRGDRMTSGGSVFLDIRNDVEVLGGSIITTGVENVGDINLIAQNNVFFNGQYGALTGLFSGVRRGDKGTGGNVYVTANHLEFINGARIDTSILGSGNAGNVFLNISDNAYFYGVHVADNFDIFSSGIYSSVAQYADGTGGEVYISAENLEVSSGAKIEVSTAGRGKAGSIFLDIDEAIYLSDFDSEISSIVDTFSIGEGGNIHIAANDLIVDKGAYINTSTYGIGNAGDITLDVDETIHVRGWTEVDNTSSIIQSGVAYRAQGSGGDIKVTASNLNVTDGGSLVASTSGIGDAGSISVNISETVRIDGVSSSEAVAHSTLSSDVQPYAQGNGGTIHIAATDLEVVNGGRVETSTSAFGSAGNIFLDIAHAALIDGVASVSGLPSRIGSDVSPDAEGTGGTIKASAEKLAINNGAQVSASTFGLGDAGQIIFDIEGTILVSGINPVLRRFSSGIFSQNNAEATVKGGRINISASDLEILDGASISAIVRNLGNAGNVTINSDNTVRVDNNSQILAESRSRAGRAGNVDITSETVSVNGQSQISVSSPGSAGDLRITANQIFIDNGDVLAKTGESLSKEENANIFLHLVDNEGDKNRSSGLLLLTNDSLISAEASNNARGGNISILEGFVIATSPVKNGNDIVAKASEGNGGSITIDVQGIFDLEERDAVTGNRTNDIDASSDFGAPGQVDLSTVGDTSNELTTLPETPVETEVVSSCQAAGSNSEALAFFDVGRGGSRTTPDDTLSHDTGLETWVSLPKTPDLSVAVSDESGAALHGNNVMKEASGASPTFTALNSSGDRIPTSQPNCFSQ